jgi:uncharacterized Zn finger protein
MEWGFYDDWRRYVPTTERRRKIARAQAALRRSGREAAPVEITGRKITTTFWGDAWCRNLEAYSDYRNRLPRGRTYVRNGAVIDLRVEAGSVHALVSGSEIYRAEIRVSPLARARWKDIQARCAGQIDSVVELLRGSISRSVMEIVTEKGEGLFPSPKEISLDCSCPDWAELCKHLAATLYGVGSRLDREPELLFTLRGVDPVDLVAAAAATTPGSERSRHRRTLASDGDLASVFGIDLEDAGARRRRPRSSSTGKKARKKTRTRAERKTRSKAGRKTGGRTHASKPRADRGGRVR